MFLVIIFYLSQVFLNLKIHALSPYCNHPCHKIPNTMCRYPAGGSPMCSGFINGLTEKQKDLVLHIHNQLRQQVVLGRQPDQPSASNMMVLSWDDEGEKIAERWAEQCQKSSTNEVQDGCRTKLDGVTGGQNLCVELPENKHTDLISFLTRRVSQWFLQGEIFKFQWSTEYSYSKNTESYSQIVWATTTSIGCGLSYNDSETDSMYRFVCNYYPAGNVLNEMIYKKGLACSQCPEGSECSKTWPGLCTTEPTDKGGKVPSDAINTEASSNTIYSSCVLLTFGLMFVYFCY